MSGERLRIREEIAGLLEELRALGTPERADGEKRYLKSDLEFLGVPVPIVRRVARAWLRRHPAIGRQECARVVRACWRTSTHELRHFGIELLRLQFALLEPGDIELLEWMLRRSRSWAYVDTLAVHVVGHLAERHTSIRQVLDRWSRDDDFWIRRSSLLALLLPLRRGTGDWQRFVCFADRMLDEREFFIRKAIGWVLRDASKKQRRLVRDYLHSRIERVSGVTLREAVKHLPASERASLLDAYRSR